MIIPASRILKIHSLRGTRSAKDPLAKLAHFKELQARYSAVKEQRERAESTQRILQQMPTAGSDEPWPWDPVPVGIAWNCH